MYGPDTGRTVGAGPQSSVNLVNADTDGPAAVYKAAVLYSADNSTV